VIHRDCVNNVDPAKPTLKQLQSLSSAIPDLCCSVKDEKALEVISIDFTVCLLTYFLYKEILSPGMQELLTLQDFGYISKLDVLSDGFYCHCDILSIYYYIFNFKQKICDSSGLMT